MTKTIIILASGSRGDVQPFIALAYALAQRGEKVRVVCNQVYESWLQSYGLEVAPIPWDPHEAMRLQVELASEKNPLTFIRRQMKNSRKVFDLTQAASWRACQGADCLVFSVLVPVGESIAEKLGIPCMAGALHPLEPTRAFPSQLILRNLGGRLNGYSHLLMEQFYQLAVGGYVNHFRKELGLPVVRFPQTILSRMRNKGVPLLCNLSPAILPRPVDWPERVQMHGYWFLPSPPAWQPPPVLVDFLAGGDAPVYIGFGSLVTSNPAETSALLVDALRRSGRRAILARGWGALQETKVDPVQILLVDDIPHGWLFERCSAVVHHGGAGTTAAALRAGAPQLIVSHMQDQPYWAQKMYQLGVSPAPVSRNSLNSAGFAHSLQQAVDDPHIRAAASQLGAQVRAEHGAEKTADFICQYFT